MSIEALVLAAGAGRRFGGSKLTAPWRDGVLLDAAVDAALAAPVRQVTVIVGEDPAVAEAAGAAALRRQAQGRLRVVRTPNPHDGLSASLRAGLESVRPDCSGVLVFLGDMPMIPHAVLTPLYAALKTGAVAAAPFHVGRRGHPVALSRRLFPELLALEGDRGAGAVLDRMSDDLVRVETSDAGVLVDIDSREDWAASRP